ncbi:hypothetical protein HAX54_019348, partial [Datura stramonium]|nr:hypothetical protein [Datura stramonium]
LKQDSLLGTRTGLAHNTGDSASLMSRHACHCARFVLRRACHCAEGPASRASGHTIMEMRRDGGCAGVASGAKCFKLRYVQPNFFIFIPKSSNTPKSIIFSSKRI